jgi:hypothetical protein
MSCVLCSGGEEEIPSKKKRIQEIDTKVEAGLLRKNRK